MFRNRLRLLINKKSVLPSVDPFSPPTDSLSPNYSSNVIGDINRVVWFDSSYVAFTRASVFYRTITEHET